MLHAIDQHHMGFFSDALNSGAKYVEKLRHLNAARQVFLFENNYRIGYPVSTSQFFSFC